MKLLIDADVVAYRAAARAEEYAEFPGGICVLWSDLPGVRAAFQEDVADLADRTGARKKEVLLCFSDTENWRKVENPAYKSNRKARKPLAYGALLDWCLAEMPCVRMPGLEADDVMGIIATSDPDAVVVTIDKDLSSVPCTLFNPDKDARPKVVEVEEADRFFWTQALTGDPVDGYGGCKGVGPKTAEKILTHIDTSDYAAAWAAVLNEYVKRGHSEEYARMNARMARICRDGDWDPATKVMLWTPPSL